MYEYDIVRLCLENNTKKNIWLRKADVSKLTGIEYRKVSRTIQMAWKCGWVVRREYSKNTGTAFAQGNYKVLQTYYQIKPNLKEKSWNRLGSTYLQVLNLEKKNKTSPNNL